MALRLKKCSGPGNRSRKSSLDRLWSMSVPILAAENTYSHIINTQNNLINWLSHNLYSKGKNVLMAAAEKHTSKQEGGQIFPPFQLKAEIILSILFILFLFYDII